MIKRKRLSVAAKTKLLNENADMQMLLKTLERGVNDIHFVAKELKEKLGEYENGRKD